MTRSNIKSVRLQLFFSSFFFFFFQALIFNLQSGIVNAQCNAWTQKADLGGITRYNPAGFSIGSKGYIGTGNDEITPYRKDFWEFDPITNIWSQMADFGGTGRRAAVGFSIGSKGYIGTGDDGVKKQDFWEYDAFSNSWTQKASFPGTGRDHAVGFSINGKGYVGTGRDPGFAQDFWEYDTTSNSWTQKANFGGTARYYASSFSIGNKGYVGTGNDGVKKQDFWEYDPGTDTWNQKTDFPLVRAVAACFSIGSKGYIGAGNGDPGLKKDFWEYDPAGDTWTQMADFGGTVRKGTIGFAIGNKGYIGTGRGDGNVLYKDFWEYNPEADVTTNICLITVDSTSTKNVIVWEKTVALIIDSFRIYREIGLNNYVHIASKAYSELSIFTDTTNGVNPVVQSYRYKISAVDTCGNESALSSHHRTIHLSTPQYTPPGTFDLIWTNDYQGFDISQYYILRAPNSGGIYTVIDSVTFGNLSYTDINAPSGNASYIIEGKHPTGCTADKKGNDYNSSISNSSGILSSVYDLMNEDAEITLYPNPSEGIFTVEATVSLQYVKLQIYDVLGKLILEKKNIKSSIKIDLSDKEKGVYQIQIITDKNVITKKFVIQ